MTKVFGVIPARFGATRFPGKPLAKIKGKELISWVIEGAKSAKSLQEILVATDDERIASVANQHGVRSVMTDSSLPSGTDRIWSAIKSEDVDVIVNIQGDEPLITGSLIDRLVEPMLTDPSLEMATLAHPLAPEDLQNLNSVKVVVNQQKNALYFSRFPIPYSRVDAKHLSGIAGAQKHIGLYAYRKTFLEKFCAAPQAEIERAESLEQLRALSLGARIRVVSVQEKLIGVDVPEDVSRVEALLR